MNLKQYFFRNLINLPGWRTNRKIVVIESDDWGSIRMPSQRTFAWLQSKGYKPENDPYLLYDSLESNDDLGLLYEVLSSVKDCKGNPAVITANALVANPDFKRIAESEFSQYYYEPVTSTLNRYPNRDKVFSLWLEGIEKKLFLLQFHGREHLNVDRWMSDLKNGDQHLRKAFELEMISISSLPNNMRFAYMEGLDYFSEKEERNKLSILEEGLAQFEQLFGYSSKSFIANCYIWNENQEEILAKNGVQFIQGIAKQIYPIIKKGNHLHRTKLHYTGQRNAKKQYYLVRNAFFEPSLLKNRQNVVEECLSRIAISFRYGKPAIIGSHRLNYIGSINVENRDRSLRLLERLLQSIIDYWPTVEFMTSEQLGDLIAGRKKMC